MTPHVRRAEVNGTRRAPDRANVIRPAASLDNGALTALVMEATAGSAYVDAPRYFLERCFAVETEDARCLVAERDGVVIGCVLFGVVAGTVGTGRLHYVAVAPDARRDRVGTALCDAAVAELRSGGARRIVAEMPDDPALRPGRSLLDAGGFAEVARVTDYFRDLVSLVILERTEGA